MSEPFPIRKTGDRVRVTFGGRKLDAVVVIASKNGQALAIEFDGLLGGPNGFYVGMMPLLWRDGAFHDLGNQGIATLEDVVE